MTPAMDNTGSPVPKVARASVVARSLGLLFRHPVDYLVFTLVSFAPGLALLALVDYVFLRGALEGPWSSNRFGLTVASYAQSVTTIFMVVMTAGFASVLVMEAVKAHLDGRGARLGPALRGLASTAVRLAVALAVAGAVANVCFALFPPLGLLALFLFCQVPQVFTNSAPRLLPGLRQSVSLVLKAPLETGLVLGFAFLYLLLVSVVRYALSIPAAVTVGYFGVQVIFGLCILPVVAWTLIALNVIYLGRAPRS